MSEGKAMKISSQNTGACSVALCKEKAVVVVVDDYTYYWVYLSSEQPFQICYKFATSVITKCDNFIANCDRYYKVLNLFFNNNCNILVKKSEITISEKRR